MVVVLMVLIIVVEIIGSFVCVNLDVYFIILFCLVMEILLMFDLLMVDCGLIYFDVELMGWIEVVLLYCESFVFVVYENINLFKMISWVVIVVMLFCLLMLDM